MEPSSGLDDATLSQLHAVLSEQPVSRELHAFCRLCPPSAGPRLLGLAPTELSQLSQRCRTAIDAWLCCDRMYEVMEDAPSLTTRDSTLPAKAKARDGACVVTGQGTGVCQVAHIIPYSAGKSQSRANSELWSVLRMFWGDTQTQELQDLIFGPPDSISPNSKTLVNRLYNVVTLSSDCHRLWSDGCFVLQPLPDDELEGRHTRHTVFQWVYPHESSQLKPGVFAPISFAEPLPPLSVTLTHNGGLICLPNVRTSPPTFIQDGHIVTFHTDDPTARPLPSRELLWLQCTLIRVLRMAGRAGWDMRETNSSESHADSVHVSDELAGESSLSSATAPVASSRYETNTTNPNPKPRFPRRLAERVKGWIHMGGISMGS